MRKLKPEFHAKKMHPLEWLLEPIEGDETYLRKKLFGSEAAYLNGKLMLAITDGEEPWNGLLVATSREDHPSLLAEWKQLKVHPVLGKWLYLSQNNPSFETTAMAIVKSVRHGDERIGVVPKPRKWKIQKKAILARKTSK